MRDLVQNFPDDIQSSIVSPNGTVASYTFAQGLPAVTPVDTSTGVVSLPNTYTINWLPDHPTRDYVESWNVSVENQWKGGFLTSARYVGSRQLQISSVFNLNAGSVGGGTASEPFNIRFGRTAATNLITPVGRNQYDALQAQLVKQFHTDYSVQVGYTYSKTFAYCCDTTAGETVGIQVPSLVYLNRALAGFDRPYILTISGTAQLPFGKNKAFLHSGVGAAIAGGWQFNGIFESYSGTPFTISSSGSSLNAPGSSQFADRVRGGKCNFGGGWHGSTAPYVDATCFAPVTAVRFGTAGFNSWPRFIDGPADGALNVEECRELASILAKSTSDYICNFRLPDIPFSGDRCSLRHLWRKLQGSPQIANLDLSIRGLAIINAVSVLDHDLTFTIAGGSSQIITVLLKKRSARVY